MTTDHNATEGGRTYDSAGYRLMPTGYERRMADGRMYQAHDREDRERARGVLARIDEETRDG